MEPIIKLVKNIMDCNSETVFKVTASLGLVLTAEEKLLEKKALFKAVFMKWLNAAETLLEMIYDKLPSPVVA